jgi:hypothetical protein
MMKNSQGIRVINLLLCGTSLMLHLSNTYIVPVIPILAILMLLLNLGPKLRINGISAPCIIIYFSGLLGYISAENKNSVRGTSIGVILPANYFDKTFSMFCLAVMSVVFGASILKNENKRSLDLDTNADYKNLVSSNVSTYLLSLVPFFGALFGFSLPQLLARDNHLTTQQFPIFARFSLAASIIALGVLSSWTRQQTKLLRFLGLLGISLYTMLYFSLSSRFLTFIPICIAFVYHNKSSKFSALILGTVTAISTLFFYMLPLYLRSLKSHGFESYVTNIQNITFAGTDFEAAFQNFVFSFDVNGLTAFSLQKFPLYDLLVEVSPLPGDLAGWYEISESHRLNSATPAAAIGEAMNYGFFYFILIFIIIGLVLGYMQRKAENFQGKVRLYSSIILTSGATYFAVLCLQYNLRSAIRILYYLLIYFTLIKMTTKSRYSFSGIKSPENF